MRNIVFLVLFTHPQLLDAPLNKIGLREKKTQNESLLSPSLHCMKYSSQSRVSWKCWTFFLFYIQTLLSKQRMEKMFWVWVEFSFQQRDAGCTYKKEFCGNIFANVWKKTFSLYFMFSLYEALTMGMKMVHIWCRLQTATRIYMIGNTRKTSKQVINVVQVCFFVYKIDSQEMSHRER